MSQYIKLFGGSVHLLEGQTDVRSIAPKKLRKIFAGPEHFLGMLSRSDICVKTKLILHGKAINQYVNMSYSFLKINNDTAVD